MIKEPVSKTLVLSPQGVTGDAGSRLKEARQYLGYSPDDVARQLNVDPSFILGVESGSGGVDEATLMKFSELYDRPYDWLSEGLVRWDSLDQDSYTPLPPELTDSDQHELRAFMQVMESRYKKANFAYRLKNLSVRVGSQDWIEEIHHELGTYEKSIAAGRVEVLDAIVEFGVTVLFRPLESVIGTLLKHGRTAGLMLSIFESESLIRLATAMVLSRLILKAEQDESDADKLWYPLSVDRQLREENEESYKSAINFLLPNFLLADMQNKQRWSNRDLENPKNIYQASLRLGASYEDTVFAYQSIGVLSDSASETLLNANLRDINRELLEGYDEFDSIDNADVWCISRKDEGSLIQANPNDLFVMNLKQSCSAGYMWNFDALEEAGFVLLKDWTEVSNTLKVGCPSRRRLIAMPAQSASGDYVIGQLRPWLGISSQTSKMAISYRRLPQLKEGLYLPELQREADVVR